MDVFVEKIVTKKKGIEDTLISAGIVLGCILGIIIVFSIPVLSTLGIFFAAAFMYFGYVFISARNVEFEYAVTNGDLDIDKIVSRRKRKRLFSASCKNFEVVAKVKSEHFNQQINSIANRVIAVSTMDSPDIYFITLDYKGQRTVVFFEPDKRMLDAFKTFIPRKVFE